MKRIITACLILAFAVLALSSCEIGAWYKYDNASKYTAGDVTLDESPKNLDIDWIAGRIRIEYSDDGKFKAEEKASSDNTSSNAPMYTWLDGDTLRIKFLNSGRRYLESFSKVLFIYVPRGTVFDNVNINSISSDLVLLNINAESINTNTVSGAVTISDCRSDALMAESVSGSLHISGSDINNVDFSSVSGSLTCGNSKLADSVEFTTISGSTMLELTEDSGFTVEFNTVSGSTTIELPVTETDGKKVYGDGSSKIKISSVSGSLIIVKSTGN